MRNIKFRGKLISSGKWVYGSLINNCFITEDKFGTPMPQHGPKDIRQFEILPVMPPSVGQFTGLHDKNGQEIYEGDVVIQHGHCIRDLQGVVVYDELSASFLLCYETFGTKHFETFQKKKVYADCNTSFTDEHTWEVIGNIHDYPELTKQTEDYEKY